MRGFKGILSMKGVWELHQRLRADAVDVVSNRGL